MIARGPSLVIRPVAAATHVTIDAGSRVAMHLHIDLARRPLRTARLPALQPQSPLVLNGSMTAGTRFTGRCIRIEYVGALHRSAGAGCGWCAPTLHAMALAATD